MDTQSGSSLVQSPLLWLIAYVVITIARDQLTVLLEVIGELLGKPFKELGEALTGALRQSQEWRKENKDHRGQAVIALKGLLELTIEGFDNVIGALDGQARMCIKTLAPERDAIPSMRVIGALVSFISMMALLFADLVGALNSLEPLLQGLIDVPPMLQELPIAIAIASGGSMLVLGMIVGDFLGQTDLSAWNTLKGPVRTATLTTALVSALMILTFSFLQALSRSVYLARFPAETEQTIIRLAALSQSLILIPMLVTTFLLFRGVVGLLLPYMVLAFALSLPFRLIRFLISLLSRVVSLGGVGSDMAAAILYSIVSMILFVLGFVFGTAGSLVVGLMLALQLLIKFLTHVPYVAYDSISTVVPRSAPPIPPVYPFPPPGSFYERPAGGGDDSVPPSDDDYWGPDPLEVSNIDDENYLSLIRHI